jgi:CheY-like chemotaxis protein
LAVAENELSTRIQTDLNKLSGNLFIHVANINTLTSLISGINEAVSNDVSFHIAIIGSAITDNLLELSSTIKNNPKFASTRLILVSEDSSDLSFEAQSYKFDSYLESSDSYEKLDYLLDQLLDRYMTQQKSTLPLLRLSVPLSQLPTKANLLLAEDNLTNQIITAKFLEKLGYKTDIANNGIEVLQCISNKKYDLIIMDCQMPEMDGFEATRRIRKGQNGLTNSNVPIIAMTAHARIEDKNNCLSSGMNDYLTKPIDPSNFSYIILRWLTQNTERSDSDIVPDDLNKKQPPVPQRLFFSQNEIFDKKGFTDRTMYDKEIAQSLIYSISSDLPSQLAKLRESIAAGDKESSLLLAHRIRGAAANMGGIIVERIAASIEIYCKAGELTKAAVLFDSLEEHSGIFLEVLKTF